MREIKFRVWYVDEMIYSSEYAIGEFDFSFDTHGEMLFSVWNDEMHELTLDGDVTYSGWDAYTKDIMQYTGMKDKDGTDIFEGDILKIELDNQIYESCIVFEHGCWVINHPYRMIYETGMPDSINIGWWTKHDNVKVVGNVCEKPPVEITK